MSQPTHRTLIASAALLAACAAQAQVYRNVGPDGRVTYSDKPPTASVRDNPGSASTNTPGAALPYQLNQTVQRFPVTLYTGNNCAGCNSGRNLLLGRGIPFTEKTIESNEDIAALQRISGGNDLPVITIGGQRLSGYSDTEWVQYLDAAGYPKSSQLPANYQRPAPTPLTTAKAAAPASRADNASAAPSAPQGPSIAPPRTVENPTGIRF